MAHLIPERLSLAMCGLFGTGWVGVGLAILSVGIAGGQTPEFTPRVVIPRAFPAIEDPPTMSRAEADRALHEAELVLGVTVGGESRAYPLNMINGPQREIINDQLGGRAIAATW